MKILVIALGAVVASLGVLGVLRNDKHHVVPASIQEEHNRRVDFPPASGAYGRALYLVVDSQGVFLGDQLIDSTVTSQVVSDFARHEGIKAAMFVVTDSAKYGDVVRIYAELRRSGLVVSSFPTVAHPTGFRLPQYGTITKEGFVWIDENTKEEFY